MNENRATELVDAFENAAIAHIGDLVLARQETALKSQKKCQDLRAQLIAALIAADKPQAKPVVMTMAEIENIRSHRATGIVQDSHYFYRTFDELLASHERLRELLRIRHAGTNSQVDAAWDEIEQIIQGVD